MVTIERELNFLDKSDWGDGPWQTEPDKRQWTDEATGLPCLAVRNEVHGHWCGYVGVPPGHRFYELPFSEVTALAASDSDSSLDVHGGLTYSDFCQEGEEERGICHVPAPGQTEHPWWLGFDMMHGFDYGPALFSGLGSFGDQIKQLAIFQLSNYRTLAYVQDQCEHLAHQLAELGAP